mmetsp:Transcript_18880/g.28718  ORF Transcript_18880/g.28718 Transcript_18880/m.28718 type:complete len:208 (-) Transcript_18880:1174-1797(-)
MKMSDDNVCVDCLSEYLNLQDNKFGGKLPSSFGLLQQLDFINLNDNRLSGAIPLDLEYVMSRIEVCMSNNYLTGELPSFSERVSDTSSHGKIKIRIERIKLDSNRLRGSIPRGFGEMTTLQELSLSQNLLSGTIVNMEKLTSMEILKLGGNKLSGSIPQILPPTLKQFDMEYNQILSIPTEIGYLTNIGMFCFRWFSCYSYIAFCLC